jgi:hypothetical protein
VSNWICDKCGANYIDVSHQEPSVLKQELELRKFKKLEKIVRYKIDPLLAVIQLMNNPIMVKQAEEIRHSYDTLIDWEIVDE